MITASLTHAHALTLTNPGGLFLVGGSSGSRPRETRILVRSALMSRGRDAHGTVRLPAGTDCAGDLAVALLCAPDLARGCDAALGELRLSGEVCCVRGLVPRLEVLRDSGVRRCLVPSQAEAGLVEGIECYAIGRLGDEPVRVEPWAWEPPRGLEDLADLPPSFGQARDHLREALRADRDVLFVREPGAGATMLARRAGALLEPPTVAQRYAIARTMSWAALAVVPWQGRPFRAPHHTASAAALVGAQGRPGEVDLARHGILFLDEIAEFSRPAMRALEERKDRGRIIAVCTEKQVEFLGPWVRGFERIALPPVSRSEYTPSPDVWTP